MKPEPRMIPAPTAPLVVNRASHLAEAAARVWRRREPTLALVLHLSRLFPPAPRPHHRRIALAIMQDCAQRHEGQVFPVGTDDIALLCPWRGDGAPELAALPGQLNRLLQADAGADQSVLSTWSLPAAGPEFLLFAQTAAPRPVPPPPPASGHAVSHALASAFASVRPGPGPIPLDAAIERAGATNLMTVRTVVLLSAPGSGQPRVQPLAREIGFSSAALEAAISLGDDPYLLRHAALHLDRWMLDLLEVGLGAGGLLDPCRPAMPPLLLKATLATLAAPRLGALLEAVRQRRGTPPLMAISLMDACADPSALLGLRRSKAGHASLVLDGVSCLALRLADPSLLGCDLVRIGGATALARLPAAAASPSEELQAALARIDPARVILDDADDESAIRWGMARGIRRFQGSQAEAMLAAARLARCPASDACTLIQCRERAVAASEPARRLCTNRPLLDAGGVHVDRTSSAERVAA